MNVNVIAEVWGSNAATTTKQYLSQGLALRARSRIAVEQIPVGCVYMRKKLTVPVGMAQKFNFHIQFEVYRLISLTVCLLN